MKFWFVLGMALLSGGCRKPVAISVGTCVPDAEGCGIKVERQGDPVYELACKPPDTKLPMSCSCRENGTSKKKVEVDRTLPKDGAEAEKFMRELCGL